MIFEFRFLISDFWVCDSFSLKGQSRDRVVAERDSRGAACLSAVALA